MTAALSLLTLSVHHRTEQHLLSLQVHQATSTLAAALPLVQTELDDALQVAEATNSPAAFTRFIRARSAGEVTFSSVSLWRRTGDSVQRLALIGADPALITDGRTGFLSGLAQADMIRITPLLPGGAVAHLGFADLPVGDTNLIVYAESALPPNGRLDLGSASPFGDIQFALYLNHVQPQDLLESTVPTPIRSRRATAIAPFGDATIILVGTPTSDPAGGLSSALPWIVLGAGIILTLGAATMTELLGRRRRVAEALAEENQRLYLEQRDIATTVQHALLPELPELDELEVAARYLPGTAGMDVGGDWYDVVCEPGRCTFVVGDVCGRGLRAATIMASLRFGTRAYVAQGDPVEIIVEKLGRLHDFDGEELFATLLIGQIDIARRRLTLVNAGHPPLLLVTPEGASFVDTPITTPVGVNPVGSTPGAPTRPPEPRAVARTIDIPDHGLLIAYTDGLVERRDLPLDTGLDDLLRAGIDPRRPVEETLDQLVTSLLPAGPVDDTAILALRWRPRPSGPPDGVRPAD